MPDASVLAPAKGKWMEWPRLAVLTVLVVLISSFTTFAVIRFIEQYKTELELVSLTTTTEQSFLKYDSAMQSLTKRVEDLEYIISGMTALKPTRSATTPESWQRNRDAELRKRIESIQRRLLELENKPQ